MIEVVWREIILVFEAQRNARPERHASKPSRVYAYKRHSKLGYMLLSESANIDNERGCEIVKSKYYVIPS